MSGPADLNVRASLIYIGLDAITTRELPNYLIEPETVVVQRDTLPNTAPNQHFGASGATLPHMIQQLADPNPGQAHLWNHQVQIVTTPPNHPTSTTLQTILQSPSTPHNHLQLRQAMRNWQNY